MKKFKFIFAALAVALSITACGKHEHSPAPKTADELRAEAQANSAKNAKLQAELEQNRSTALENIKTNVAGYFATNPRFQPASDWTVIAHTDDYIDPSCPQGSGWGWANVMNTKIKTDGQPTKIRVYCSTSSSSLGCYKDDDFLASPHAKQQKTCNGNLPTPLKPIK